MKRKFLFLFRCADKSFPPLTAASEQLLVELNVWFSEETIVKCEHKALESTQQC